MDPRLPRRASADLLIRRLSQHVAPGSEVTVRRACARCGHREHGRPIVAGAPVIASVAYAGDLVVVAVADTRLCGAVGIDAERRASTRRAAMRGVIEPGRRASLRRWTRVEAALKADGRGLMVDPARVRIVHSLRGIHAWIVDEPGGGGDSIRSRLQRVRGPRGVVISLALAPAAPLGTICRPAAGSSRMGPAPFIPRAGAAAGAPDA